MGPLLSRGCLQSPKLRVPAGAALEGLAEDKGIATRLGGKGQCTPTKGTLWRSRPVLQCKFTESQGTTARPRLCTGQPTGMCKADGHAAPWGEGKASQGDTRMVPRVWPGFSRGISYSVQGPCSPRESQLPGTVWAAAGSPCRGDGLGGLIQGAPGIQPWGW